MRLKPDMPAFVATTLFVVILTTYLVLVLYFPTAYIFATYEDLIGEWMQFFGFAAALVFSVGIAIRRGPYRWFFILMAIACLYTVMEEISWGQRLFGFATPEILLEHNLQGEANLHNLLTGPVSTSGKIVIAYLLSAGMLGYGLFYPLALASDWRIGRWLDSKGVAAPPAYLWPYFAAAAVFEADLLDFNEAEIAELLVAFALALQAVHYWYRQRLFADRSVSARPPGNVSARIGYSMSIVIAAIGLLSAATTYGLYNNSTWRPAIDKRLLNGYEKFAGRYGAYGRWDIAALLYVRAQVNDPDNVYYLTEIATAFRKAGNETLAGIYRNKAFAEAREDLAEQPDDLHANLAMVRLYRQTGDVQHANVLERRANQLALEGLRKNPRSAYHAYWLAMTYREMGEYPMARDYFRLASELAPTSAKYQRAYLELSDGIGTE